MTTAIETPPGPTPAQERELLERVSSLRTGLTMWVPFFGHLLLKLEPMVARPQHNVPTAGVTRDRKLFLNVDFCNKLTDAELAFVLCHEVMHPAYACFERGESRKAMVMTSMGNVTLWNVAHDYAINDIIHQMTRDNHKVKMPKGGCRDDKWRDFSAEEIYDALLDEAKENAEANGPGQPGDSGQGEAISLPDDVWGVDDIRPDLGGGSNPDGSDATEGTGRLSEAEKSELDDYWDVALVEAAQIHEQRGQGSLPASLRKMIEEITDPKIAWRDVLSRWVGENGRRTDFTWRRPSRRSDAIGELLPSLQRHGVDDVVVLWDTSGSMYGREVEIMSEVIGICEDLNLTLRVICCDTQVASDNHNVESPEDVNWAGGGASCFLPAFELLHEEGYQGVLVAFTDGYITVPSLKPPHIREVLWVLWEGKDVDPTGGTWGEAIVVDGDGNVR